KKKLPGMYHQFKELGDIDITKEPMEIGPTTHYMMGGVRVDALTQMSTVPGLVAAGECGAGLHGANRLGGNSLSDLLVFGKLAGEHAASYARSAGVVKVDPSVVDACVKRCLAPFERSSGEGPFEIHKDLQEFMQTNVGIVRRHDELERAAPMIESFRKRLDSVSVCGNREYNPGWHMAMDLRNMLVVSEAISRAAVDRKESRGAHFRDDYEGKDEK